MEQGDGYRVVGSSDAVVKPAQAEGAHVYCRAGRAEYDDETHEIWYDGQFAYSV